MSEFAELREYLGDCFRQIGDRFDRLEDRLTMHDAEFEEVHRKLGKLDAVEADVRSMYKLLDEHAGKVEAYAQEMHLLSRQFARHERWHHEVAEKAGVRLKY